MTSAEWGLGVTLLALASVAALGWNTVAAIWCGHAVRPIPFGAGLCFVLVAASALATQGGPEAALVAGVSAQADPCYRPSRIASLDADGSQLRATIDYGGPASCVLWGALEDPRTGTVWLQGPASTQSGARVLDLVLGDGGSDRLDYQLTIVAIPPDQSAEWLGAFESGALLSAERVPHPRLVSDVSVYAGRWPR